MDIDVAGVLHSLRQLEREHGGIHCAERTAADVATTHLKKRPRIDNMRFGAAMVSRGYVPKDKVGAAELGMKLARQMLPGGKKRPAGEALPADAVTLPFYAGCAIPQDHELHAVVHEVAAGFGVRLERGGGRRLLRPPEPRRRRQPVRDRGARLHGVPGLRREPRRERHRGGPALGRAHRARRPQLDDHAARRPASASSPTSAASPTATPPWRRSATPPSSPAPRWWSTTRPCTTAAAAPSGGMYRGATKSSARLLEFAARQQAPVVTTCVLCRDNLRSAARELKLDVPVHFWPEFFRAVPTAPEERTDD